MSKKINGKNKTMEKLIIYTFKFFKDVALHSEKFSDLG